MCQPQTVEKISAPGHVERYARQWQCVEVFLIALFLVAIRPLSSRTLAINVVFRKFSSTPRVP